MSALPLIDPNLNHCPFVFNAYRQKDVARFLRLLDEEGGVLLGVVSARGVIFSSGYSIHYEHTRHLDMEVLC